MNSAKRAIQARREDTEDRILDAFETVLCSGGIRNLSINAVVAEAGLSKTLVYRYFGSLSGLVQEWGRRRAVFVDTDPPEGTGEENFPEFLDLIESDMQKTAAHLRSHPVTLEFLAEELTGHNEYSEAFNEVRSKTRRGSIRRMMRDSRYTQPENRGLIVLVYAAITHLAMRSRHAPSFFGINLNTDKGWDEAMSFVAGIFDDARLAAKYRKEKGVTDDR